MELDCSNDTRPILAAGENLLVWLNVLSLDAPLVALVWQDFFARALRVELDAAPRIVLALSVWLAYAADRWLDGWKIRKGLSARHRFAQHYRVPLAVTWICILAITIACAWIALSRTAFQDGLILLAAIAAYFALTHLPWPWKWLRGFKEVGVAILFATGTTLFALVKMRLPAGEAVVPMASWSLLCFLNCYAISGWEFERDRAQRQESLLTRWPALRCRFRPVAGALAGMTLALFLSHLGQPLSLIYAATAASALGLILLDCYSLRLDVRRTAADLVLLTPLLFLVLPAP